MTSTLSIPNAPDLTLDDYLVLGLATCFIKEEGEIQAVKLVEPIPSAALEAILTGIPTSYQMVTATTFGSILSDNGLQLSADFPTEAQFCDEFLTRSIAAARTYKANSRTKELIPLHTTRTDLNYSTERKRVLNTHRLVRTEDNVKQHEYTHKVL